jgi:type VI secretion system secreted protein Hcp
MVGTPTRRAGRDGQCGDRQRGSAPVRSPAMAAVEYFLKLNGIKGGSNDAKHRDELDVDAFSWGVNQTGTAAVGSGAAAGKAQVHDFSITARMSVASPLLFQACATGQHIKDAVFTARNANGSEFLRVSMTQVVVSSYMTGGPEADAPMDSVTFGCAKVAFEYRPTLANGAAGPPVIANWDLKAGK